MTLLGIGLVLLSVVFIFVGFGFHITAYGLRMFDTASSTRTEVVLGWLFWVAAAASLVSGLILLV